MWQKKQIENVTAYYPFKSQIVQKIKCSGGTSILDYYLVQNV